MKISILIPTYNRAEILRQTLDSFVKLGLEGLDVEIIVIANNCTDHTTDVVHAYQSQIPIMLHVERKPGKNNALNSALATFEMNEIVIFTDDDVAPNQDWLQQIARSCHVYTEFSVFGGQIYPIWPESKLPFWTKDIFIRGTVYSSHLIGDGVKPVKYSSGFPCGANLWMRKTIFDAGFRFDPGIGPAPVRKIMGSETSFLKRLKEAGYEFLHVPSSIVGHRIKPHEINLSYAFKRIALNARSAPISMGFHRPQLYKMHPQLWRVRTFISLVYWFMLLFVFWFPYNRKTWIWRFGLAYHRVILNSSALRYSFLRSR